MRKHFRTVVIVAAVLILIALGMTGVKRLMYNSFSGLSEAEFRDEMQVVTALPPDASDATMEYACENISDLRLRTLNVAYSSRLTQSELGDFHMGKLQPAGWTPLDPKAPLDPSGPPIDLYKETDDGNRMTLDLKLETKEGVTLVRVHASVGAKRNAC